MIYIIGIIILIALAIKPRNTRKDLQSIAYRENINNAITPIDDVQNINGELAHKTSLAISKNIEERKNYPEDKQWQISISFRKSASKNFDSALFLAKRSQNYVETESKGQIIHQAFFDAASYSDFETLYKLIKDWKSTFIMLNGELIDKKSMSQLNRCLGDKVRFKEPSFCFGASTFTENPFGCHRLMITPSQKPWWEYGNYNFKKEWIIDKKQIKEQIVSKSLFYNKCPYFNLDRALSVADYLPDKLTYQRDKDDFTFTDNGVYRRISYLEIDL